LVAPWPRTHPPMRHPGVVLAVVCPGQGAQSPGMLSPWLEIPSFAERMKHFSNAIGLDLVQHGTTSDANTIRDTSVAQPLLVATALASVRELLSESTPDLAAGHSVGEFAAVALAGVLPDDIALRLVSIRARAMAEAASRAEPASMAAVLGGDSADIDKTLAALGLIPANANGGGQVVAAGPQDAIAKLVASPPAKSRVIELEVAGAFHTDDMLPAVDDLADAASTVTPDDPVKTLLSNADGTVVESGEQALKRLIAQVAKPVRWDLCQETMHKMGVTAIVEAAPGGVLTGLAKRTMKGVPCVALKTPADLDAARQLMETHA